MGREVHRRYIVVFNHLTNKRPVSNKSTLPLAVERKVLSLFPALNRVVPDESFSWKRKVSKHLLLCKDLKSWTDGRWTSPCDVGTW